ncbi:hypothetical protein [Actinomadura macrotermitis]|uniref:Ferric reductase n=1 Tax=Actinomadura macrotermitis TaxID=2585200 RepID=A0A7K0BN19_9ACTN|nr:hypothetical protein [Actinomadura macrotermitis]MQY02476.1 hypothetical protein [Actinomadura macrotermitis]
MKTHSSDDPLVPAWALRAVVIGALAVLAGAATPPGAVLAAGAQRFLSFYAGVFTLLALTAAVVGGLLATERLVLGIRHRVLAQGAHRAASVLAVTFVVAHLLVKVLGGLAAPAQAVLPGTGPVGLGALAFDLMLAVVATGLLRARFAVRGRPWAWRSMHALAYVSWPLAIGHGLTAGRAAAPWVTLSYVLCLAGVALALLTRMIVVVRPREVRRAGAGIGPPAAVRTRAPARGAVRTPAGEGETVR